MARFQFRLATLLRLREAARDERRLQLAQAYQAEALLQQQAQHLRAELQRLAEQAREAARPGPVNVDRLLDLRRYCAVVMAEEQETQARLRMIADEIERRRQALAEANREVRVLELLRDRQAQRHREGEQHQEIKQLDEAAQQRALREEHP